MARADRPPPGRGRMQLRYRTVLTGEQYVTAQAWRSATLPRCPNHPGGGCSLARHGTYKRKTPPGTQIARWYCRRSHTTFSLLPDCLAARLPGTLAELEDAVATAENAPSLAAVAATVHRRPQEPAGAVRWLRRRVARVGRALTAARGLLPERFRGCAATVTAFRARLGTDAALVWLRELAAPRLHALPSPVGYAHHRQGRGLPAGRRQQRAGRDPPPGGAQRAPHRPPRRRTRPPTWREPSTTTPGRPWRCSATASSRTWSTCRRERRASAPDCAPRPNSTTSSPAPTAPASPPRPSATGSTGIARAASMPCIRRTAPTAAAPAACPPTSPSCWSRSRRIARRCPCAPSSTSPANAACRPMSACRSPPSTACSPARDCSTGSPTTPSRRCAASRTAMPTSCGRATSCTAPPSATAGAAARPT